MAINYEKYFGEGGLWSEYLASALIFKRGYRKKLIELDTYLKGEQNLHNKDSKEKYILQSVANYLKVIYKSQASYLQNFSHKFKLSPQTNIEANVQGVDILGKYAKSIWETSNVHDIIDEVILQSCGQPMGIIKLLWENNIDLDFNNNVIYNNTLISSKVDVNNFFWDPTATKIEECKFAYEVKKLRFSDLLNVPQFKTSTEEAWVKLKTMYDNFKGNYVKDRGFTTDGYAELWETYFTNSQHSILSTPLSAQLLAVNEVYVKEGNIVYQFFTLGPDILLYSTTLGISKLPYSILYENKFPHDFMGFTAVMDNIDKQKMLDLTEKILANNVKLQGNNTILVGKNARMNLKSVATHIHSPNSIFAVNGDPANALAYLHPPQFPTDILQLSNTVKSDMSAVSGASGAAIGQNVGSLTTSNGVNSLIGQSMSQNEYRKVHYTHFLKRAIGILFEYLSNMKGAVSFRSTTEADKESGVFDFQTIDPLIIKMLRYDIEVLLDGSKLDQQRNINIINILLQYQAQTGEKILDSAAIIKLLDLPNSDELIAKLAAAQVQEQQNQQKEMKVAQAAATLTYQGLMAASKDPQGQGQVSAQQLIQNSVQKAIEEVNQPQQQGGQSQKGFAGTASTRNIA